VVEIPSNKSIQNWIKKIALTKFFYSVFYEIIHVLQTYAIIIIISSIIAFFIVVCSLL
jgi:hypothetical protein